MLTVAFFCLPETLYVRNRIRPVPDQATSTKFTKASYAHRLRLWTRDPDLHLEAKQFVIPTVKMMRYPSVIFPALYLATQYGLASILPAVTVASIFTKFFGWNTLQIGLAYGAALTIGGSLGELAAGMVVDAIVKRERKKLGGRNPDPEVRLKAIWTGEILVPAGLLIYGFTLTYRSLWIAPILGMGIACFGLQIITTTCYTYSIDCYRAEASEVSQVFNFWRQEFGMTFAFYVIPMADKIGYQWVFFFFAVVGSVLGFIPILGLMFRGKRVREWMGRPSGINAFDTDPA